jgi:hypothetical protein
MAHKLCDLAAAGEDQRAYAIRPDRLPVNSTAPTKHSAIDRHAELDARDGGHFSSNIKISSDTVGQQKAAKIPSRTRILSAEAELFLRYGIAGVSVEAIAKAAATTKRTLYDHFVSKDELVAEYLRESAKRLDVCWAEIDPRGSPSALVQLGTAAHAKAPSTRPRVQYP